MVLEPAHFLAFPAGYGPVINTQCLVGDHKVLAYSDYLAESSAYRTGPERAVEAEHILVRLPECHPVRLESVVELPDFHLVIRRSRADHVHFPVTF